MNRHACRMGNSSVYSFRIYQSGFLSGYFGQKWKDSRKLLFKPLLIEDFAL